MSAATIWCGASLVSGTRDRVAIGLLCAMSPGVVDSISGFSPDAATGRELLAAAEIARTHTCTRESARACLSLFLSCSHPSRADFPRTRARNTLMLDAIKHVSRRRAQAVSARCPTTDAGYHISIARDDFAARSCVGHAGTIDEHASTAVTAICIRCYLRGTASCERFASTREKRTSRKMVPAG